LHIGYLPNNAQRKRSNNNNAQRKRSNNNNAQRKRSNELLSPYKQRSTQAQQRIAKSIQTTLNASAATNC
jgi:hypothetical protein